MDKKTGSSFDWLGRISDGALDKAPAPLFWILAVLFLIIGVFLLTITI